MNKNNKEPYFLPATQRAQITEDKPIGKNLICIIYSTHQIVSQILNSKSKNVLSIYFSTRFFYLDQNSIRNANVADYFTKKKYFWKPLKKQQCKFCGKKLVKTCRESIIILDLIRITIKIE